MITLKSTTSDGSAFQVYDNDRLIGQIIKTRGPSGDRYLASINININMDVLEKSSNKEFDASHQALQWIERNECP
jgi:hypothetical protein